MSAFLESIEAWTKRTLQVPPPPEYPAGSEDFVEVFRASPGYLTYKLIQTGIQQVFLFIGLLFFVGFPFGLSFSAREGWGFLSVILGLIPVFVFGFYVAQLPFAFLRAWLDYRMRWYIITSRSLRIREGIWTVNEKTLTYANIQNMGIEQGPIQRWLGISDLEVRTAGGGGGDPTQQGVTSAMHTGYFRGVENAVSIRDLIAAQLRKRHTPGLGEGDTAEEPVREDAPDAPDLARRIEAAADRLLAAAPR